MARGKHLTVDCRNVPDQTVLDDKKMVETMAMAATKAGANVINTNRYHFGYDSPPGFTCVVLLDESHITAHAYYHLEEDGKEPINLLAMDCFTCGSTSPMDVLKYIQEEIDLGDIKIVEMDRFL